jgi:hypothetical protein
MAGDAARDIGGKVSNLARDDKAAGRSLDAPTNGALFLGAG